MNSLFEVSEWRYVEQTKSLEREKRGFDLIRYLKLFEELNEMIFFHLSISKSKQESLFILSFSSSFFLIIYHHLSS